MSVLVTVKFHGDTETFRKVLSERADELVEFSKRGRAAGAIHHRFGIGDGWVLVVDEWESPAQFETFFSTPDLKQFIADSGANPDLPPEITVCEAVASPDEF